MIDLSDLDTLGLLKAHAEILTELRTRGIVRSSNNPVADYAEGLCVKAFGWTPAPKSTKGYDATDVEGVRYEIKARRITAVNPSRQVSAIRGLDAQHFAYLAGVLFDENFVVIRAALIPYVVVVANATFVPHSNSSRFLLRDKVWTQPGLRDITEILKKAQS